ncbi:hypothetical protein ACFQL1_03785 [Halomicroarcula sp. GCM10025709]|uniref:hypothetical protein n=1 Tax=Haloarcula TaxID=2237 RepID=UPI0024C2E9FB|nr:hypothetical protein [Halomicroarcula sp. YJ-61-S]
MDRLSSCYFCGVALDASLSEYPVVPRALRPAGGDDRTVVLCPTCRRKLATILEPVVAAAGESEASDGVAGDAATLPSAADDEDLTGMLDESGMEPQPDPMELSDASEADTDDTPTPDGDSAPSPASGPEQHPDAEDASEQRPATAPSGNGTENGDGTSDPDRAASTADGESDRSEDDDDPDEQADDSQGLTRLEYNKVMRLLQNRELPVDRAEIQAVAVNAYEIQPDEFDTIVDAAIERDLIAEREGQLVAPE